jgi:hypothetical protein
MTQRKTRNIASALSILKQLGFPRAQQNERSALTLLALLDLSPGKTWKQAASPLMGITPIMEWMRQHYDKGYKPNTRETVRRQTMHQFVAAGLALYNPDLPERPVNSPDAVYQVSQEALRLLRAYGSKAWSSQLTEYLSHIDTLASRYAKPRQLHQIPVKVNRKATFKLSPGKHSALVKAIIEEFGSRFIPNGELVYAGDTVKKWGFFDQAALSKLDVTVDAHGKMPDVVMLCPLRNWLVLVEAVTSHGPVDGKRHEELRQIFADASAGIVYVTAFPDRAIMSRYLGDIAWETEVWVADSPDHLIHFNGSRFLGPYPDKQITSKHT